MIEVYRTHAGHGYERLIKQLYEYDIKFSDRLIDKDAPKEWIAKIIGLAENVEDVISTRNLEKYNITMEQVKDMTLDELVEMTRTHRGLLKELIIIDGIYIQAGYNREEVGFLIYRYTGKWAS